MRYRRFLKPMFAALWLFASALPTLASNPLDRPGQEDPHFARRAMLQPKLESISYFRATDAISLRFSLHNPGSKSLWVLGWMLPSDDMDANLLQVTRDGEAVPYLGPLVKRAPAVAEDWMEIKAGETFSVVFDPSAFYEMSGVGQYAIRFNVKALAVRYAPPRDAMDPARNLGLAAPVQAEAEPQGKVTLSAAGTEFYFEGLPGGPRPQVRELALIGGYTRCTTSQQSLLSTAHQNAQLISGLATNAVGTGTFTWWFGTSSASALKPHYTAINNAFANQNVTYDCGCKKRYYAYVYANQPYKIYVCSVFWQTTDMGRDSRAGTLVHEMSHFTVVVGTSDYVYGATGAHNLALTDPAKAAMNADNHEYFAEDQKMN